MNVRPIYNGLEGFTLKVTVEEMIIITGCVGAICHADLQKSGVVATPQMPLYNGCVKALEEANVPIPIVIVNHS